MNYIHRMFLRSPSRSGFDKSRPQVGICVQIRSSAVRERFLEYNRRFSLGCPLLPRVGEEAALDGAFAISFLRRPAILCS